MSKRVEICGINTAELPKLNHQETIALLRRAQSGDEAARDEFLLANMRLVLSIVGRFGGKKESADDLFQVGCIGLIKAMENFDPDMNLRFSTYAVPMIIGEIRRFLRDCSPLRVSRSIRDTAYKVLQTRTELEADLGQEADLERISEAMHIPLKEVVYAMDAISDPVSLFDPVYHDGNETVMIMDQVGDVKNCDENWLTGVSIGEAMSKLSDRERQILNLRFYEGKTQVEVSAEIGISQAQVSRLEKSAIGILKKNIS